MVDIRPHAALAQDQGLGAEAFSAHSKKNAVNTYSQVFLLVYFYQLIIAELIDR